jgi:TonB-dependent receptor
LLAGLRGEWVRTHTLTYFRARTTAIAAEPDPFTRAGLDFEKQSRNGQYHKWFPSYHAVYDITPNFKARASWSTSYGRPTRQNIIPTPVINDANRTVTIGNASLKPQMAKSINLKLEYYFKTGMVSVSGYKKRITDYISSALRSGELVPKGPDNGFDGLAEDYEIIQSANIGNATLKGLEFDYRQRLAFLPGLLKGLTIRGNYTYLETYGRFAGTTNLQNGQVAGFLPHSYNAGVSYTYRKFSVSWDINWTGKFPTAYPVNPSTPNSYIYRRALDMQSVGMSYKILPDATLFVNLNNIEQHGQSYYIWTPDRPRQNYTVARSLKFGISGQF